MLERCKRPYPAAPGHALTRVITIADMSAAQHGVRSSVGAADQARDALEQLRSWSEHRTT